MAQTVEAVLEANGEFRFLEPLTVTKRTRLLVTVVPERSVAEVYEQAKAAQDSPEAVARRAEAVAEYRAGRALSTADAVTLFQSIVAGDAKK
jgi:hypothetical protein